MVCFRPIESWMQENGQLTCNRMKARGPTMLICCNKCRGCRVAKVQGLTLRMMHEKKMHKESCFITLTFADEHLPEAGTLRKRDVQLFMKRLRATKDFGAGVRFFACGEYGDLNKRPHYHVILFNRDFDDAIYWRRTGAGNELYRSATLEKLWPFGSSEVGEVTEQSCGYCAGYVMKKMGGKRAEAHYQVFDSDGVVHQREPEFATWSRVPGLGNAFFWKYVDEIIDNDSCILRGREVPVPAYYLRKYRQRFGVNADWNDFERFVKAEEQRELTAEHRRPERLAVREEVLRLNQARFSKPLD
jgi:hypothetical protein